MTRDRLYQAGALLLVLLHGGTARADASFFPWEEAAAPPQCRADASGDRTCPRLAPLQSHGGCTGEECNCTPKRTCEDNCDVTIFDGCRNIKCSCTSAEDVCFRKKCCTPKKCAAYQCGTPADGCGGRMRCGNACPPGRRCNQARHFCEEIPAR